MKTFLRSVYFWFSLLTICAILFPVSLFIFLITVAFDRNRRILHLFACFWSFVVMKANPYWKVHIEGKEKIKKGVQYVMVANHSSAVDILLLYQLFLPFKWVAKKSIYYVPFIGWNMWLNGYISIERSKGRSRLEMMDRAADSIRAGNSVMMFPEGTRTTDGKIKSFKTGSFRLALQMKAPILPIAVKGSFYTLKKGGISVNANADLRVMIMDPVIYEDFSDSDSKEIARNIQNLIAEKLNSSADAVV